MIYKLRLKLSEKFFLWGKLIHPDIARLRKEILETQERMSKDYKLIVGNLKE